MAVTAGKRPRPVTEYFAEQKALGKCSACNRSEFSFLQPGNIIKGIGDQFFSRSTFTDDQNRVMGFSGIRFLPVGYDFSSHLMGSTAEAFNASGFLKKKNPLNNRFLGLVLPGDGVDPVLLGRFHAFFIGHKNDKGIVSQVLNMRTLLGTSAQFINATVICNDNGRVPARKQQKRRQAMELQLYLFALIQFSKKSPVFRRCL